MPYPNEHSARLKDPGQFESFARENNKGGNGVDFIYGIKEGKSEIQAIRFDKKKFTVQEAKKWLKDHDQNYIDFEPASGAEHSEFGNAWFEIFRTGAHTDSSGKTSDWTEKDLDEIVSLYDPAVHEAPIVLGHPEHDSPAYGWIEEIKRVGDRLLAKPKQLVDDFKNLIRKGSYKKVSIALYPDLGLRHVGFLGGTTPAVKGLKQAIFGEKKAKWIIESDIDEITAVTQSFSSDPGKKGGNIMYDWLTKMKEAIGLAEKQLTPDPSVKFTEADVSAKVKEMEGKIRKEAEATFAEAQKKIEAERKEKEAAQARLKEIETKARKDEIAAFCEAQCKEGKLTPALRKIIEPIMIAVSAGEGFKPSDAIEFSETVKKPALDGIKDFLTELPKVVIFREVTPGEGPAVGTEDEKRKQLISLFCEKNPKASYKDAVIAVAKENPELFKQI